MASKRTIIQDWMVAQKRYHLTDTQVQMARELGFKTTSLPKIDNHKQKSWKTPLPQYIESLYEKRFKREKPEVVKSLNQQLKEDEIKRKAKKKAKDANRVAKAVGQSVNRDIQLMDLIEGGKMAVESSGWPCWVTSRRIFDSQRLFLSKFAT